MQVRTGRCLLPNILRSKGLTRTQLSDRTGISRSQISQWISGSRTMNIENAKIIVEELNLKCIDELYEWIIWEDERPTESSE